MTARLTRRSIGRRLGRLGLPGMVGIGLWVMSATLYFSAVLPAQQRLEEARHSAASLQERIARAGRQLSANERPAAEQLAEFYRAFPDERSSPDWIGKISATAQSCGLSLDQGDYKPSRDKIGKLIRLQMTLPVKGEYGQIRRFLASTGANVPIASLEHVQFERQKVGDPLVDAKIRLVLYLEQPS
ncbi:MAG: type 4a pilus biogenesis protein PilO [Thiobacillus sp.]|jgi:Tfp pilus assembly protein PilO|uniref:type 4a pilus biogenesis protein PilO n=1 Tax=Thiobacillus sp. TaxID=924 RepID=UPI002893E613|nr:type 4a pilus biogenesis protein PilO [Thiobacillus sp.]MDT3708216.1 type 4a pilus biogenesis protein PilO [Thiobacillus sp.]